MATMTQQMECDLCEAVANVLAKHGLHPSECDEIHGWTPEMAAEFAGLLESQIAKIELPATLPTKAPVTADSKTKDTDEHEGLTEYTATYRITAVSTIWAEDAEEADEIAGDQIPYPDVDGGDCDSADLDEIIIEEA